jgi:DNA-binding transcriptional regulator YiaG
MIMPVEIRAVRVDLFGMSQEEFSTYTGVRLDRLIELEKGNTAASEEEEVRIRAAIPDDLP